MNFSNFSKKDVLEKLTLTHGIERDIESRKCKYIKESNSKIRVVKRMI